MARVHIGCGAGFAGDRFDAAVPIVRQLAEHDGPRYLIFEVLGERTLAIAQRLRQDDPDKGYSPFLETYLRPILADCRRHSVRIVSNLGAANPLGAAHRVRALAAELGVPDLRVAALTGDDLLQVMTVDELRRQDTIEGVAVGNRPIVAANAYLGARSVATALATGADVVLVGRTTDAALVLGPLLHEFGWAEDDWDRLAAGTVCGHLLECGGQVTGAYFADPGFKDVPDLARVGFPIAEVAADGDLVITKPGGTGGLVSRATVIEQLLYEMHDPTSYLTPDVTLDVSDVAIEEAGPDRVRVTGAKGHPRPEELKVTISVESGWLGEAEISYAGPNAYARADLAARVVRERCGLIGIEDPLRVEIIGTGTVYDNDAGAARAAAAFPSDGEYRVRAAVRSLDRAVAESVADEVLSLYCSGPAAGGGVRQSVTSQISTASILIDRARVEHHVAVTEVGP
ncbi:MAG: acyclic terpene utilization AtuA family protein [Methyloligellaceae bacterium]